MAWACLDRIKKRAPMLILYEDTLYGPLSYSQKGGYIQNKSIGGETRKREKWVRQPIPREKKKKRKGECPFWSHRPVLSADPERGTKCINSRQHRGNDNKGQSQREGEFKARVHTIRIAAMLKAVTSQKSVSWGKE